MIHHSSTVTSRRSTKPSSLPPRAGFNRTHRLVPAVWRGECRSCPWADYCRGELEALDHISLLPAVGTHDTAQLLDSGITTTTQMASLTSGATFGEYSVTEEAILQSHARASGTLLRRPDVDLELPDAAYQIDFDVETYLGTLYLAGLLIHEPGGAAFRPISDWTGTPDGERASSNSSSGTSTRSPTGEMRWSITGPGTSARF